MMRSLALLLAFLAAAPLYAARPLKQSTAITIPVGPFTDTAGAPVTSMTVTSVVSRIYKGASPTPATLSLTASGGSNDLVADSTTGQWTMELTTTDTGTVGPLRVSYYLSGVFLPFHEDFIVYPANVYDALAGTDRLEVDSREQSGTALTARDIGASVLLSSGTGTGQISLSSGAVLLQPTQTGVTIPTVTTITNAPPLHADWVDGGRLDLILDARASQTSVNTIDDLIGDPAIDLATDIADKATASALASLVSDIGTNGAGLTALPWNASWDAEVQSEVDDALVAKGLDHLVFTSVTGTDIADNSIIARMASKSATADWDSFVNTTDSLEAIRDNLGGGGGGGATAEEIRIEMDANSTKLAAIVADTNELQTDWADGGRLDLILDARASQASVNTIDDFVDTEVAAIKAKTDLIPGTIDGYTLQESLALIQAAAAGDIATGPVIKSPTGETRITADVDEDGNRTNTLNVTNPN